MSATDAMTDLKMAHERVTEEMRIVSGRGRNAQPEWSLLERARWHIQQAQLDLAKAIAPIGRESPNE